MTARWYVIHAYSGFESKVAQSIREQAAQKGMEHQIIDVQVPTEEVVRMRRGAKVSSERKFFPGYVLAKIDMTDESWHLVKNTPKVTGFPGGAQPVPLTEEEVKGILEQMAGESARPKPKFSFERGENVRVIEGPFMNFNGVVEEVHPEKGKVKVMVSIFGRATPVELEFPQVEKV